MSRSDRESPYDFGPYEDEYQGIALDQDEAGRGPLILLLALGVLLIFAGVVWNTYRQGIRIEESALPLITSETSTFKRAPEQSGGLQAEGQQSAFYDPMDGMGDPAQAPTGSSADLELAGALETVSGSGEATRTAYQNDRPQPLRPEPQISQQSAQTSSRLAVQTDRFDSSGDYQVQLSALRSEEAALAAWSTIRRDSPDLYENAPMQIQRADLGARGVFYRLRVGQFAERARANSFCDDIKATGRDCMVVAKVSG